MSGLGQRYEAEEIDGLDFGYYGLYGDEAPQAQPEPAPAPAPVPPPAPAPAPAPEQAAPPPPGVTEPRPIEADQNLLREALSRGIRGPRRLTDIVFFGRHPALKDNPAWSNDGALLDEWRQIRERLVLPEVRQRFAPPPRFVRYRRVRPVRLYPNPFPRFGRMPVELGQVPNPDNMPTQPLPNIPSPDPMPINPLPPKQWCPELNKVIGSLCFPYEPLEIAVSKTEAGHLTPDVVLIPAGVVQPNIVLSCFYLVIRDFGVDWRHVKQSTKDEQFFKDWLNRFETDPSLSMRIIGYSDCVGVERNNFLLRRGRARNVFNLLGSSARSRVMSVSAAPFGTYLTNNSTVAARAQTRAVVIEVFVGSPGVI